jgi:hypothetical protein
MRIIATLALLLTIGSVSASAQEIFDTSYTTHTGERVLRIESTIPVSVNEVWAAFTTEKGLASWVAPVVKLDLRVGGALSTNYDKNALIGSPGTIRLPILNYLEREMITFKVNLNDSLSKKAQAEDKNLQEIVQIVDLGNGRSKVISSMIGWGEGKEWDEIYRFFAKGNRWTYEQLIKAMKKP